MKLLITFILGACTGAFLLWFGFSQEVVMVGNGRLVRLDRFTGKASSVFVSSLERVRGEQAELAQLEALEAAPGAATPGWRELSAAEIGRLEFKWQRNGSRGVALSFHNPLEKRVRINRVRVRIAAHGEHAAVDRTYELRDCTCGALADKLELLETQGIDWDVIVPVKDEGAGGGAPFAAPPGAVAPKGVSGSVTPVLVMMMP